MSEQDALSVRDATDRAISAVGPPPSHSGLVAVIRKLADQIDSIGPDGLNPGGRLDNTVVPTYLNYAKALGMWSEAKAAPAAKPVASEPAPVPAGASATITSLQSKVAELKKAR